MTPPNDIDRYIEAFAPDAFDTDYHIHDWSDQPDPVVALSRHERDEDEGRNIVVGVIKVKAPTKNDAFRANRHFERFIVAHEAAAVIDFFWKRYKRVIQTAKQAEERLASGDQEATLKLLRDIIEFEKP